MGGRGYGWYHYLAPFTNLLSLNSNIVVFTEENIGDLVHEYFHAQDFTDYKIVIHDLNTYRHSDNIYKLKEELGFIDEKGLIEGTPKAPRNRNHHICLSKTVFLAWSIKERLFETDDYYWVDGGLFHHGLVPYSLGGMEYMTVPEKNRMWPENENSISNPSFFEKLSKRTPKNLTFLGCDTLSNRSPAHVQFFNKKKITHIIGGLFGGKKNAVLEFCEKVETSVDCLFNNKVLSLEEEIYSGVFADSFSDQGYLSFTHWGHDKPDEPNYLHVPPGSDSFYKLFL